MNLILLEYEEIDQPLPLEDERAQHVLQVLRRRKGDSFDVGLVDGPKGKAVLEKVSSKSIELSFVWGDEDPPLLPIDVIVGLSRPQTNRKILQEATSLGVRSMRFVLTERGEPSYAKSRLWSTGEWRRHLIAGAAQAFSTRLPQVEYGLELGKAIELVPTNSCCLALDNYEAKGSLGSLLPSTSSLTLAIGSERGWTGSERDLLRDSGFTLADLGGRVLRSETALVAALGIARERVVEPTEK